MKFKTTVTLSLAALMLTQVCQPVCRAQQMTDEQIFAAIREDPYRAAAGAYPYHFASTEYTRAPKGYKPFYISHIGRHGSRYQLDRDAKYVSSCHLLDSLHEAGALTAVGDSLCHEMRAIYDAHLNMEGMLTFKGTEEHKGIARRMAARSPQVFCQKDRNIVNCVSTTVHRTIQSMGGFAIGLASSFPDLDIRINCTFPHIGHDNLKPGEEQVDIAGAKKAALDAVSEVEQAMTPTAEELSGLRERLFAGYDASVETMYRLFYAASTSSCLDIDVDPLRFFTTEELFAFYRRCDVRFCGLYGTLATAGGKMAECMIPTLRHMVEDADAAIRGNGRCADFRFCHDTNVGPIMALLGIGGFAVTARPDAPYRYWQSFKQICMASNLQLEFYRNRKGDILVKALYNEQEAAFPGLEAVNGIYYRWRDVRKYMMDKCE